MEDEDWDETILGPKDEDRFVQSTPDPPLESNPRLREQSSGAVGPPSSMFKQSIPSSRPAPLEPEAAEPPGLSSRRISGRFERESVEVELLPDQRIRQEALRMLEVADDHLADSSYSVYRTSTGGFSAAPRTAGEKRTPSALSGFSFTTARKNLAKPFRYDDEDTEAPAPRKENYDHADDDVLDVAIMENRSASSRPVDDSRNWSSRYSIDTTLLALSGGSVSSSKFMDKTDKEYSDTRRSSQNVNFSSPSEAESPRIFGSGFSFRKSNVFGKQNVTVKNEPNLNTAWKDKKTEEEAVTPARSWQEQFQQQRRHRRYIFTGLAIVLLLIIIIFSVVGTRDNRSEPAASSPPPDIQEPTTAEDPSVTFYITSDVPLTPAREQAFKDDLQSMSKVASFFVHLGDIQVADYTRCVSDRYSKVSGILRTSPLPVFIVPGEEDWANCPNQEEAWGHWVETFMEYEKKFNSEFDVLHYDELPENFAFVEKNVLFVGVHETNGRIDDLTELNNRNLNNINCRC